MIKPIYKAGKTPPAPADRPYGYRPVALCECTLKICEGLFIELLRDKIEAAMGENYAYIKFRGVEVAVQDL